MKRIKQIENDGTGKFIAFDGVKYRPEIETEFCAKAVVTFTLPHEDTGDSYATVTGGTVTETWKPTGV